MSRPRKTALLLALSALAVFAYVPSAGSEPPVCTLVGCNNGVLLAVKKRPADTHVMVFCVEDRCRRARIGNGGTLRVTCQAAESVDVVVVARAKGGKRLGRFTETVPLEALQPNGPGCPPTCYSGSVQLNGRQLTAL